MNTTQSPWKTIQLVVALLVQTTEKGILYLTGIKRNKILAGFTAPIGGHVESGEQLFVACLREMREESGYRLDTTEKVPEPVAHVSIDIGGMRTTFHIRVYLIRFEDVTGEFVPDLEEYVELSFKRYEDLPLHLIPPGDEEWIPHALAGKPYARVHIECGNDRLDVRRIVVDGVERRRITPA